MTMLPDEPELVRRAQRGDTDAYRKIVEAHQQIALRTAFVITGSHADAEEATQDAFVKAYRALGRFRRDVPLRPWLLTIVGNEARNRRRAASIREALPLDDEIEITADADAGHEAALNADRRRQLRPALAKLSPADREIVGCRYFLELSERETASALGIRAGTVKSRLSRALDRLRNELEGTNV